MAVHSTRLVGQTGLTSGTTNLYTVPAGKRTIVKSILVVNADAAAKRIVLKAMASGVDFCFWVFYCTAVATNGEQQFMEPWTVLNAGEVIRLVAAGTGCTVVISGAELTL